MSAGIQASTASVNQQAGQIAVNLRNTFQQVISLNAWITAIGGAAGLVTLGFTQADAQVIVSTYANLAALAAIYQGQPQSTEALPFNFETNSNLLWGGQ